MKKIIFSIAAILLFCPATLPAGTECRVVELPDRYEAICEGDERFLPSNLSQPARKPVVAAPVGGGPAASVAKSSVESSSAASSTAARMSEVKKSDPMVIAPAVAQLISFRKNRLQGSDLEAKKAVRIRNIMAGRQKEAVPAQNDNSMQND